jgi:hypothetical protein
MGGNIVELAYARNDDTEPDPAPELHRPSLRVVAGSPSAPRPPLPRRPSRRAVIRAHVWGVPISTQGGRVVVQDPRDLRIAEAVRLLGRG